MPTCDAASCRTFTGRLVTIRSPAARVFDFRRFCEIGFSRIPRYSEKHCNIDNCEPLRAERRAGQWRVRREGRAGSGSQHGAGIERSSRRTAEFCRRSGTRCQLSSRLLSVYRNRRLKNTAETRHSPSGGERTEARCTLLTREAEFRKLGIERLLGQITN